MRAKAKNANDPLLISLCISCVIIDQAVDPHGNWIPFQNHSNDHMANYVNRFWAGTLSLFCIFGTSRMFTWKLQQ